MEDLAIPLISGGASMLFSWLVYLTIKTHENKQAIAVNTANDHQVSEDLKRIYRAIDEQKASFSSDFKEFRAEINGKLDLFMANELTYLKGIRKNEQ